MKLKTSMLTAIIVVGAAMAQQQYDARATYQQQQAMKEVERLSQQFDQLNENFEQMTARMQRLESGNSVADIRAEISGIKAQIAELKREQENMRREIVAEISRKMAALINRPAPPAPPTPPTPPPAAGNRGRNAPSAPSTAAKPPPHDAAPSGPYYEHIVEPGQTLSLIAKGYDTTVQKILAANPNLKPNSLRVGQKVIVPAEDKK